MNGQFAERDAERGRGKTHNLRHVQDDDGRLEADTDTSDETTSDDDAEGVAETSDHLDDDTNHVDEAAENDSPLAAHEVGEVAGDESAKEGTARQDGDDERRVGLGHLGGGGIQSLDEDLGTEHTVDVTGVVAEEDATERGKGADEVGLPGDGSLDALDVLGGSQAADVRGRRGGALLLVRGHG